MCLIGMFASASRRSLPLHQTLLDLFEGGKQTWPFTRTSKNSLLFYFFSFLDFGNTEIIQTYGTFNYNCTSVVQNNYNLPTFYQFSPKHREFSSIAVISQFLYGLAYAIGKSQTIQIRPPHLMNRTIVQYNSRYKASSKST